MVPHVEPWYRFARVLALVAKASGSISPECRWVDLGCHNFSFMRMVRDSFHIIPTGVDVFPSDLVSPEDREFGYVQANLEEGVPYVGPADIISALETIEHIIDTDHFLEQCRERLAPGGWLVITTPNINSLRNRVVVPLGRYPAGPEFRNVIHHVRLYNRRVLSDQLREHGFHIVRCAGVSFFPQRALRLGPVRRLSELLADRWPQLCSHLIMLARAQV